MREQLDELRAARDQLEQLVEVIVEIGSNLDLDVTLHRIVDAAVQLTGARYGVLGIRGPTGTQSPSSTRVSTKTPRDCSAKCRWVRAFASRM